MNFPLVKKSSVKFYTTLMALSIEYPNESQLYGRIYYLVTYENGTELIYLTTNEPDSRFVEHKFDEEFTRILSLKQLIDDFEKTELNGIAFDAGFNAPPKYIYYDIITIDDLLKPLLLTHLEESISGYTDLDFNENEKKQLKVWLDYLRS